MARRVFQLVVLLPVGVIVGVLLMVVAVSVGSHLPHPFAHKPSQAEIDKCLQDLDWDNVFHPWDDTYADPAVRLAECSRRD